MKKISGNELLNYALSLLAGRALSIAEVRVRLAKRAADPNEVEPTLAKLKEYGYLNDARFAQHYATVRGGSFGQQRVLRDLRQRRVAAPVAEHAVKQAFEDIDEPAAVRNWMERKFRNTDLAEYLSDPKHLASAYRKLRYAGFSSGAAIRVLKEYSERAGEIEEEEGSI